MHSISVQRDITERKQFEAKILESQRMNTIAQLASGVAHEVRNPLNAILAITEALSLDLKLELGSLKRINLAQQRLTPKEEPFFGESPVIKKMIELASLASETDSPVLILGETGVGKGVLAHWIHEHGSRASAPFVELNCSGLRGELLASELFGHTKGAFTSAIKDRQGLFEVADGGTLFLDEIGDMDLGIQSQFLKVIEEKQYRRLGEVIVRRSDFRLICASNKDLPTEVKQGKFRNDLFFRINIFPIHIPPLRDRIGDLKGLVRHLIKT